LTVVARSRETFCCADKSGKWRYLRRKQELLAIRDVADALYPTDDDDDEDDVNEFASQESDRNSSASEVAEDIVGHNNMMNSNNISDAVEEAAPELEILN